MRPCVAIKASGIMRKSEMQERLLESTKKTKGGEMITLKAYDKYLKKMAERDAKEADNKRREKQKKEKTK